MGKSTYIRGQMTNYVMYDEHMPIAGHCKNCGHSADAHMPDTKCMFGPATYVPWVWEQKVSELDNGMTASWWQMGDATMGYELFGPPAKKMVGYDSVSMSYKVKVHPPEPRTPKEKLRAFHAQLNKKARRW